MQAPSTTFTRQQVATLAGVDEEVIGFWIKQELLVASEGGEGRGSHRKFDAFQVNIAAILAELRRYGINIGTMRQLASLLQRGTALAASAECNFFALSNAIDLVGRLARFRRGEPVTVIDQPESYWESHPGFEVQHRANAYYDSRRRDARTEDEVVEHAVGEDDDAHDESKKIAAFSARLGEGDVLPIELFNDLNEGFYRYIWDDHIMDWGGHDWIVGAQNDGSLQVFRGPPGHDLLGFGGEGLRSGIFISPGSIFRSVWGEIVQPILIHEPARSEAFLQRRREAIERMRSGHTRVAEHAAPAPHQSEGAKAG